ncbi:MAG TPA: hypothetical protein VGS78_10545 [Candidatus Sulfotelmatobacter sp.]|nr:hypothetical protein [Candidatus Sulfotelmatobacter sp.]
MSGTNRKCANAGVYDPYQRDYRAWDREEDDAHRHWLETKNEAYVNYNRLSRKMQREYWK